MDTLEQLEAGHQKTGELIGRIKHISELDGADLDLIDNLLGDIDALIAGESEILNGIMEGATMEERNATATFDIRDGALFLREGSTLPDPLRSNLEHNPIPLDSAYHVAIAARIGAKMTVKLDNHDVVPGATEAGFTWATFMPHKADGVVYQVTAVYW